MFVSTAPVFYFVDTGSQTKMFTLRAMLKGYRVVKGLRMEAYQTEYMCNLSIDWDTAESKAKKFAAHDGIEYKVLSGDVSLEAIARLKSGEREALIRAREEAKLEKDNKAAQERSDAIVEFFASDSSFIKTPQFGKYADDSRTFEEIAAFDDDYVSFIAEIPAPTNGLWESKAQFQADWVRENVSIIERSPSEHVGEVKDKIGRYMTCINKTGFATDYNWVDRYTCRDENDNIFLVDYTGCKWSMEVGCEYHVSGAVKAHDEYRGVKQTKLTRAKVLSREDFDVIVAEQAAKKVKSPKAPASIKAPKKGSKMDQARSIFAESSSESRKDIINKFMSELDMGQAGAATYYQKCKKEAQ